MLLIHCIWWQRCACFTPPKLLVVAEILVELLTYCGWSETFFGVNREAFLELEH